MITKFCNRIQERSGIILESRTFIKHGIKFKNVGSRSLSFWNRIQERSSNGIFLGTLDRSGIENLIFPVVVRAAPILRWALLRVDNCHMVTLQYGKMYNGEGIGRC